MLARTHAHGGALALAHAHTYAQLATCTGREWQKLVYRQLCKWFSHAQCSSKEQCDDEDYLRQLYKLLGQEMQKRSEPVCDMISMCSSATEGLSLRGLAAASVLLDRSQCGPIDRSDRRPMRGPSVLWSLGLASALQAAPLRVASLCELNPRAPSNFGLLLVLIN